MAELRGFYISITVGGEGEVLTLKSEPARHGGVLLHELACGLGNRAGALLLLALAAGLVLKYKRPGICSCRSRNWQGTCT